MLTKAKLLTKIEDLKCDLEFEKREICKLKREFWALQRFLKIEIVDEPARTVVKSNIKNT